MILLDKEYVDRSSLWRMPFYIEWDPDDPVSSQQAQDLDFPDIVAEGPFLLVVHDDAAWAGQDADRLYCVAERSLDKQNFKNWKPLADLYVKSMGISRQSMLLRYAAMKRYLAQGEYRDTPQPWEDAYHWPDKDDLAWSALLYGRHPWLEAYEDKHGKRWVSHI